MAVKSRAAAESRVTSLTAILLMVGFVAAGLLLLWVAALPRVVAASSWSPFLGQLGGLLAATGLLTIAWDLWGKRTFADEVFAKARVGADVARSGIVRITDQWLAEVEWRDLFRGARTLDIFVAYANTWRNAHRADLQRLLARPDARVRVFLPDTDDPETMALLAFRFNTTVDVLKQKILEAVADYRAMGEAARGSVKVYLRKGDIVFSAYRFDNRAVLTLYSHSRQRQTAVPAFVVAGGDLFRFVQSEIEAIAQQSEEAQ